MKVLVTGAAGFIGAALALRLLERGDAVVGIDNLDPYYDVSLKQARLERLRARDGFRDVRADLLDPGALQAVFARERPGTVVHLAAQPGVRASLDDARGCIDANLAGFGAVLEACRRYGVGHLVYASSSAVYGNGALPSSERDGAGHPLSLYAATKRANELMAHSYSALHGLPSTGLRLFTVYGPWGRPDMVLFAFARRIAEGRAIEVFNRGRHRRDFTYIDDAVEVLVRAVDRPAAANGRWCADAPDPASSLAPHRILNVGSGRLVTLERCVEVLERCLGRRAARILQPLQPGDVEDSQADVGDLAEALGYVPDTPFETGVERFVAWYRTFHGLR